MVPRTWIREAVAVLRRGELVAYPTETAYALGADVTNSGAVRRIYRMKGRPGNKPLATIAADIATVKKFFVLNRLAARLARRYWPGPLTIVLPVRDENVRRVLGSRVGVRVSPHPVARALARGLGRPIVATSANRSGRGNSFSIADVCNQFGTTMIRSMVAEGRLPRRKTSTVVEIRRGKIIVHRRGAIPHVVFG